jgi:hypothetical protein
LLLLAAADHFPLEAGSFIFTQDMGISRADYAATILPNGKILLAGGSSEGPVTLQSAQLYDPVAGTFSATGNLNTPRENHTATLLANGKVLIAGGSSPPLADLDTAEIYDPATGLFTPCAGTMPLAMSGHTATLLQSGKVLLAGSWLPQNGAQLYDPSTDSFSLTGNMNASRSFFTATLLQSGKVLVSGGFSDNAGYLSTAELYDPDAGSFGPGGNMTTARSSQSATLLPNGQVLIAGGFNGVYLASAELYDPTLGTFSTTQSMATARSGHTATLLPDNTVLIASGDASCGYPCGTVTPTAEIFDPPSNSFTSTGSLNVARDRMTATLLPTGAVLIAGGTDTENFLSSAELYVGSPPPPIVLIVPGIFGTKLASSSQVVWLSNETIYDTAPPLNLPDLYQLQYDSSGQPTTPLSVQAIDHGTDYGGLFNIASEKGQLNYELECTLPIQTILAISGQICYRDFNVYNSLANGLVASGFTYAVFPYDWREDIAQLADQLNQAVNTLSVQYPGRTISLVAHSMGGLVVGEMFAKYGVSPLISHVITLGSPFLGSVEPYFEFEAWRSFYPGPGITLQQSQEIGANWTAAYELLPQWKFVSLQNGVKPPVFSIYNGTYSSLFPALPRSQGPNSALTLAAALWTAEKSVPSIPQAYAIIGSGIPTLTVLTNNLSKGACLQGVYSDGDNMVPINSALGSSWVPAQNRGYVKAQHAELPENGSVINAIIQILNGNIPTTLSQAPFGVRPTSTGCCPGPTCQPPGKN